MKQSAHRATASLAAGEDPTEIKAMCISRVQDILGYATDCLAGFRYASEIPRDLRNRAEDTITSVFGISSMEMSRFKEYEGRWNSFDPKVRRKWLEALRFDLKSALSKLELTPPGRYAALSYGVIENEAKLGSPIAMRLGVPESTSEFLKRLNEECRRIQVNLQQGCLDAAAFLLRKVLETSIVERFRKERRMADITQDGHIMGLEDLLGKASRSAGGFIHPNLVRQLLDEKLLIDITVHSLGYDPAPEDIDHAISRIGAALADARIAEL